MAGDSLHFTVNFICCDLLLLHTIPFFFSNINFAIEFLHAIRKSKRRRNMRPQKRNLHWTNVINRIIGDSIDTAMSVRTIIRASYCAAAPLTT